MTSLRVSDVRFATARHEEAKRGLLGWARFVLNDSLVVEAAVRRTLKGDLRLSYPIRSDREGGKHTVVHPRDDEARRRIERLVIEQLNLDGGTL